MQPLKTTLTAFHNVQKIIKTVPTRVYHREKTVEAEFSQCLNDWQQLWYPDCSLVLVEAKYKPHDIWSFDDTIPAAGL